MQEDVEHRSVTLAINTTKMTGRVLKNAITKLLAHIKNKRRQSKDVIPHGKQSVKQLIGQNQGVTNIEINDDGIQAFKRIARKYGVDFAIKRVKGKEAGKSTYLVFFKGRDSDALTAAFTEYTNKRVQHKQRPSIRKALARLKLPMNRTKVKHKNREQTL